MDPIRLLVAEDHPLTLAGLRMVIDTQPDWSLCAEICDGDAFLDALAAHRPDVVVLDLGLPGRTGLDLLLEMASLGSGAQTIVLSGQSEPGAFARALDAGAMAVLSKSDPPELLVEAVGVVRAGGRYVSPGLADRLQPAAGRDVALTHRERDVLRQMARGLSTKEIGRSLEISPGTAKKHRENLMRKLGTSTAVSAVRRARRLGLLSE